MVMGKRRPLYGGERGIRNRGDPVTKQLRTFAKSDFMHDFGEDIDTRDRYTDADTARFTEIARSYGIGQVKAATTAFEMVLNSNPYKLIDENIVAIYPENALLPAESKSEFQHEPQVLLSAGINYDGKEPTSLKNMIKTVKARTPLTTSKEVFPIELDNRVEVNIPGGGKWKYNVTGVPMKIEGKSGNIATLFHKVTRGKTKFALIIDAAGGLSMTELKNTDLTPDPPPGCEFYIIENIENDSDSATKLKNFEKPKTAGREALAPIVYTLKDVKNAIVYPPFNTRLQSDPAEVLFGNATLTLSRAGEETEADFTFSDDPSKSYHIENVSQNGNVKNASLNLLASAIKNGFSIEKYKDKGKDFLKLNPNGSTSREPYLFPYIKRVGDWCQALSLLDVSREYTLTKDVPNPANPSKTTRVKATVPNPADRTKQMEITTLKDLKKLDVEVGLVTMDRILLAYALSLGLDVFFTTGSDLGLLLYFKNTELELTNAELAARNKDMFDKIAEYQKAENKVNLTDNYRAVIDAAVASINSTVNEVDYIKLLRAGLYRASIARNDFANLNLKLSQLYSEIEPAAGDPKKLNQIFFDMLTILKKIEVDHKHNQTQITSITTYPNLALDNPTYDTMKGRATSRAAIARLKTIISKDMYNDVLQVKEVFDKTYRSYNPANVQYADIWTAFKVLNPPNLPNPTGAKRGGGLDEDVKSLQQFVVTPLDESTYKMLSEAITTGNFIMPTTDISGNPRNLVVGMNGVPLTDKNGNYLTVIPDPITGAPIYDGPLPLVVGTYYRDNNSHPYTVVNQFIMTEEDLPTFQKIRAEDFDNLAPGLPKILASRLLLLYADMLQGEIEKIIASDDDYKQPKLNPDGTEMVIDGKTVYEKIEPSDTKTSNVKRVYYIASKLLLEVYGNKLWNEDWKGAYTDASKEYNTAKDMDNEEIKVAAMGRYGLREGQPDDPYGFGQTLERIKTLRLSIMGAIATTGPPSGRKRQLNERNVVVQPPRVPAKGTERPTKMRVIGGTKTRRNKKSSTRRSTA